MGSIRALKFEKMPKKLKFLIKKLLIKKFGTHGGHDVYTKVVDIDKIHLNMRYGTDPSTQI